MDHSFRSRPATRLRSPFPALLQLVSRMLDWLIRLVQLSEEEQQDAGIYLGDQRFE